MPGIRLSCAAAAMLAITSVAAQDVPGQPVAVATVTISQPVVANGKPLAPGKYDVRILDHRPTLNGRSSETQRSVEFVQNGKVIGQEVAEVFEAERLSASAAVGTSRVATANAVVQTLKGGEFVRIAITDAAERFLIYLPTEQFSQPEPRPDPPSRIELPPQP
jgi:hypothetical protein